MCLFGLGALLSDCYPQLLLALGRHPDYLCDNAQDKWGKAFFGGKCISPAELADLRRGLVVVITVRNYESICAQLAALGIENVFLACYDRGYNLIRAIKRPPISPWSVPAQVPPVVPVTNRWTLVTGASRGVGRQIALEMAKLGSNIVAHSRSIDHVEEVVRGCTAFGVSAIPISADLGDMQELETMLSRLTAMVPHIDIVYNNAGIANHSQLGSIEPREFMKCLMVNTVAPVHICQRLIPPMVKRGFGRLINVTSSIERRPEEVGYACSKAALNKFVHDMAPTLSGSGVSICAVDPGWVRTDMTNFSAPHPPESVIPGVLLGALLDCDVNGCWFSAQDYAGMGLEAAIRKAIFLGPGSLGTYGQGV